MHCVFYFFISSIHRIRSIRRVSRDGKDASFEGRIVHFPPESAFLLWFSLCKYFCLFVLWLAVSTNMLLTKEERYNWENWKYRRQLYGYCKLVYVFTEYLTLEFPNLLQNVNCQFKSEVLLNIFPFSFKEATLRNNRKLASMNRENHEDIDHEGATALETQILESKKTVLPKSQEIEGRVTKKFSGVQ